MAVTRQVKMNLNTPDDSWNTYAIVVYDRANTTIGKKNIHLTVAPSPHDALRFSVGAGFITDEWLHTILGSVEERKRKPCFSYASSIQVPKHPLQVREEARREAERRFSKASDEWSDEDGKSTATSFNSETAEPPEEIAWKDWRDMYDLMMETDPGLHDTIVRIVRVSRRYSVSSSDPPYVLAYLDYKREPIIRLCNACNLPSAIITFYRISSYANILEPPVWKYHRPIRSTQSPSIPAWVPNIPDDKLPAIRIPGSAIVSPPKQPSYPLQERARYLFEIMMGCGSVSPPLPMKGIASVQSISNSVCKSPSFRRSVPRLSQVEVVVHSTGSEESV